MSVSGNNGDGCGEPNPLSRLDNGVPPEVELKKEFWNKTGSEATIWRDLLGSKLSGRTSPLGTSGHIGQTKRSAEGESWVLVP